MPVTIHPSATEPAVPATHVRQWVWWLLGVLLLVASLLVAGRLLLDPWLRRQAEKQVTERTHGRYQLRVGALHTNLLSGTLKVRSIWLRTVAGTSPDTAALPRVRLHLHRLELHGVGLLQLLRRGVVPVDSIVLDSLQLQLASAPQSSSSRPLHAQLPLDGLRLGLLAMRHVSILYGPDAAPVVQVARASGELRDVMLSAAGRADSSRIGYAAAVVGQVRDLRLRVPGHRLQVAHGLVSSEKGRLVLDSVLIHPLTAISARRTATVRVQTVVPQVLLTGVDFTRLARKQLQADTLQLQLTHLAVTLPSTPPPPLHQLLASYLTECRVQHFLFTNQTLRLEGLPQKPMLRAVQLTGTGIQVLPRSRKTLYYARTWQIRTGRGRAILSAPYYVLGWRALAADTRTGTLQLTALGMTPTMSVQEMSRRKKHQVAHIVTRVGRCTFTGFDYAAALRRHEVRANALTLRNGIIRTTGDGRFPINPNYSIATPEALGRLPFRFAVDQLRIERGTINMVYRSPRDPQPGMMSINRFSATLRNVSNDPTRMSAARPLTGNASGYIQNRAFARLALRANVLDPNGRHTLNGTFYATPLGILNPMMIPARGIAFRSGQVQRIRFQMQLNRQWVRGTMWGGYSDLKLQLLNKKNKPGLLKRVETSVINGVFIRDNNPRKPGQPLKTARIASRRELRYSVFSLWKQGLISGMLNSAGVPAKLAQSLSESGD